MKMKTVLLLLGLFPAIVSAEIYKYIDNNGQLRFTDDLSRVPVAQRSQVKKYKEIKPVPVKHLPQTNETVISTPANTSQNNPTAAQFTSKRQRLQSKKENLDLVFKQLMNEKQKLAKHKVTLHAKIEFEEYNQKAKLLNAKIAAYEKRRHLFNSEISVYNQSVEKDLIEKIKEANQRQSQ